MSYASVMEILRTGMSSGPGTEDPRYAGFAGQRLYDNYASTAEPWGAPLAGQRLYDDYASTAQPWGAPIAGGLPGPPAYQCADACFNFCEKWLPGAERGCKDTCAKMCHSLAVPSQPQPAKPAVVRPLMAAQHQASFGNIVAGKSRADAIRLGSVARSASIAAPTQQQRNMRECAEGCWGLANREQYEACRQECFCTQYPSTCGVLYD